MEPKLLEEIAGKHEFHFDGKSQVIIFSVKEGILMANLEGDISNVLNLLEGEEMTFVSPPPDGPEYHSKFVRDEEGKITKCFDSIPSIGIEAEGIRIKES